MKWAPVDWKPKWARIDCHMLSMDVEFLVIVLREMMGQKFAICPSIKSSWATFWAALRRFGVPSGSSTRPLRGLALVFLVQVVPVTRNGANPGSSERESKLSSVSSSQNWWWFHSWWGSTASEHVGLTWSNLKESLESNSGWSSSKQNASFAWVFKLSVERVEHCHHVNKGQRKKVYEMFKVKTESLFSSVKTKVEWCLCQGRAKHAWNESSC